MTKAQSKRATGDIIFEKNKDKRSFSYKSYQYNIEIGNIINTNVKHAVVFQQIDSVNYINQLKFISFENEEIHEKIIDTLGVGTLIDFRLVDKNSDGNKDLLISLGGNRQLDHLYVFDQNKDTIIKIPNFSDYPSSQTVKDTNLLFSYLALGCADQVWESKLIRIVNFKVIEFGRIYGQNCDPDNNSIIEIFNKASKIKSLPYFLTLDKYDHGKFDFIKSYWNNNASNF